MTLTRKDFVAALVGGTVTLWLTGCGDDDAGSGPAGAGGAGGGAAGAGGGAGAPGGCPATSISDNHGHALTIPEADLQATSDRTYDLRGTALHTHSVTLTPGDLQELQAGNPVVLTSTGAFHTHVVTVRCA